jgi:hypothetical protein
MLTEQIAVTLAVADALEALGVPYAIGGSLASALHGAWVRSHGAEAPTTNLCSCPFVVRTSVRFQGCNLCTSIAN